MNLWLERVRAWRKSHFFKFGLPFLTLVVGGSFMLVDFQRVKYEAQAEKRGKRLLEQQGMSTRVDLREEAEKMAEATSQFKWQNIRGPRPYEDNSEFLSLREAQEKRIQEALERAEKTVAEKKPKEVG